MVDHPLSSNDSAPTSSGASDSDEDNWKPQSPFSESSGSPELNRARGATLPVPGPGLVRSTAAAFGLSERFVFVGICSRYYDLRRCRLVEVKHLRQRLPPLPRLTIGERPLQWLAHRPPLLRRFVGRDRGVVRIEVVAGVLEVGEQEFAVPKDRVVRHVARAKALEY